MTGTAQGPGTGNNQIQLAAALAYADDALNGYKVQTISGTGSGQVRTISDYTGSSDTATVSVDWAVNPSSDTGYIVWQTAVNSFGTPGRDYTSLATWEAATDVDIVTGTVNPVLECYEDAASYDTDPVSFAGATVNSTYFRILRAASGARHGGVPGAGVKFVITASNTGTSGFTISAEGYFRMQDLEIVRNADPGTAAAIHVVYVSGSAGVELVGLLVTGSNADAGGSMNGIYAIQSSVTDLRVVNCIVYGCDGNGISTRNNSARVLNNTVVGCTGTGYTYGTTMPVWINNIGWNNGTDFNGTGYTGTDYNLSKDASAPGANSITSHTADPFTASGSNDYTLTAAHAGADLSTDTFAFDDDIAGNTRS